MLPTLYRHADADALTEALAQAMRADLDRALAARGRASLVVSGGGTPRPVLARLAQLETAWQHVCITLADERWVEPTAEASNERMVRATLLDGPAAQAGFIPLWNAAPTPEAAVDDRNRALAAMPRPFDLVQLGMGEDGHTASLFPGVSGPGLDPANPANCLAVHPCAAPHARLSLSLSALLDSRHLLLLIKGETKWRVYQQALQPGPIDAMPIRAILHQDRVPVSVYWCP